MPYDNSTVRIDRRDDPETRPRALPDRSRRLLSSDPKGENDLVSNYDQLFRDLALKQYNNETMFEYGWYGANSIDCRTGYVNGLPGSGESLTLGKPGSQMMAIPTFYFEFEDGDQRRDVSVCNYALILNKAGDTYRMNTYAGMG